MLNRWWYPFARAALFRLPAETAHDVALNTLSRAHRAGLTRLVRPCASKQPVEVFGLEFGNRIGLAAGLDKNGDHIDALGALGFGFVEVGTVTPRPQPGNPKPRMFRVERADAIINRLGFNNKGVNYLAERLEKRQYSGVLGVNIGKNKDTPEDQAASDYVTCLERVYPLADYITINISSPNTQGLRNLQSPDQLQRLIDAVFNAKARLSTTHAADVPMLVKVAPDLSEEALDGIADCLNRSPVAGVIATNTTIARPGVEGLRHGDETGGLSGAPLMQQSTLVLRQLRERLNQRIQLIGLGGIFCHEDAAEKLAAGASLVQVYTGFIYRGPQLINEMISGLAD